MTLIQKQVYLRRLYGYDSVHNAELKHLIERQIISQLSTERQFYFKQNNEKQLSLMSEKIQSSINLLQHPSNCSNARILVCPIDFPDWGLGFLIHQISFCLTFSIRSGRTLVLLNEYYTLVAFKVKWVNLFDQLSNCSYTEHVKPFAPIKEYLEPEQADKIVIFQYRHEMLFRGFNVAPLQIKEFLLKYHSNPILWFHGQLTKYIWRENQMTKSLTNQIVSRIPFECGPVVGIHVRQTDKIKEARIHELVEYMKWVDFWFDVMEENHQNATVPANCTNLRRMLFIAADLPILKDVVEEAKSKWGDKYEIYHGTLFKNTQYESMGALIEILAVYRILAKCQFLVCTLSSNTCQIIYELMQTIQGDASENTHSLDYFYSEFWMGKQMEATTDYKPTNESTNEELWAEKGDIIGLKGMVQKDGFIRGKSNRLNKEGKFPIYLIKEHPQFENISLFFNIS